MVVLIELVNEFKLLVDVSIESTRFFKFNVVVATEELNRSTLELSVPILLVKDELKLVIVLVNPLVVVAIEELRLLTLELNVEYPVVPVILTCAELDTTESESNLDLIVVLIEDVNEFNELVEVSIKPNLLFCVEFVESFELV